MEYYLSVGNEKRGPYSVAELAARGIGAEALVMAVDGGAWQPAWQVEELRPILRSASSPSGSESVATDEPQVEAQPVVGQPVQEAPEVVQGYVPQSEAPSGAGVGAQVPPRKKHRGGCWVALLVAVVLLVGLLVATCPKPEQHAQAVSGVVSETVSDAFATDSADTDDPIAVAMKEFARGATHQVVSMVVSNALTVDNYGVCSVGRVHYADKSPVVSVGVLGHVFTVGKDDLANLATRYTKDLRQQLEQNVRQKVRESITSPIQRMLGGSVGDLIDDLEREFFGGQRGQDDAPQDDGQAMGDSI